MNGPRRPLAAAIAAAGLILAGCTDPYQRPSTTPASPPVSGEQPTPPVARAGRSAPAASPLPSTATAAARQAAALTGTWKAATAGERQRRLAQLSVGSARRDALQAAARLPTDPLLARGHATSDATVQAVALRGTSTHRAGLVVTREQLTVAGQTQTRYRVTLVRAVRTTGGWAISSWRPQE